MKKVIIYIIISIFFINENVAQSEIDALRYSQKYISGSARFVGMSGAFGALGGDLGAVTINPASAGLFIANQFTISPQVVLDETDTKYLSGTETAYDLKKGFNIGNLGYVGSYQTGETTGLAAVNFGITFNRAADFNQRYKITGTNTESSMIDAFINYANGTHPDDLWSYVDQLAFDTKIIAYDYDNGEYYTGLPAINEQNQTQTKKKETKGGMNEFDISLGANFSNKFYFGGSIGITSVNYREDSYFSEDNNKLIGNDYDVKYFRLDETLIVSGVGMNIKIGAILRPVNWVRIGIALHSGTFLAINESYDTNMQSEVMYYDNEGNLTDNYESFDYAPADNNGYEIGPLISEYYIKTPGKAILSLAFVVKEFALISLDYERINYSKISMDAFDFELDDANNNIKDIYRASNNIRIGAEIKNGIYSLRAGAAYYDSPYKEEDFFIDPNQLSFSGGAGINKGNLFFDVAYAVTNYNRTDYFYSVPDDMTLVGADVSSKKSKIVATLGFRF